MNRIKRAALAIRKDYKDDRGEDWTHASDAAWMIKYGVLPGFIIAIIIGAILVATGNS